MTEVEIIVEIFKGETTIDDHLQQWVWQNQMRGRLF
jgi:hypothetical protein